MPGLSVETLPGPDYADVMKGESETKWGTGAARHDAAGGKDQSRNLKHTQAAAVCYCDAG